VRVILAEHVADHACALDVRAVPDVVGLVHREQDAPVNGLEAVAHIRERAPHDYAHGVIEIGAPHLLLEADRESFLGYLVHLDVRRHGNRPFSSGAAASHGQPWSAGVIHEGNRPVVGRSGGPTAWEKF
jgi:hypothetical protein